MNGGPFFWYLSSCSHEESRVQDGSLCIPKSLRSGEHKHIVVTANVRETMEEDVVNDPLLISWKTRDIHG